jgi:hypothetical protein
MIGEEIDVPPNPAHVFGKPEQDTPPLPGSEKQTT